MRSINYLNWVQDIRFWIFIFFLLRLYGIHFAPLEVGHNWRQTTVLMVARNFLEVDPNVFLPRVDTAGHLSGITGMEFPLLNYLIYWISEIFGYEHWYGRLINLSVSSVGIWFYYKILRRYFSEQLSFSASIILLVSIWFKFSRKIMPDTFSLSLMIASIYYGLSYLESQKGKFKDLLLYSILILLGGLSKLPSAYLLIIFCIPFFRKDIAGSQKLIFTAFSIISLSPILFWYFQWVPYLVEKYQYWNFFMGISVQEGVDQLIANWAQASQRFYQTAIQFSGFALFLLGLYFAFRQKEKKILLPLAVLSIGFLVIMLKSGYTFSHHSYYILPFVPVMSLVAAYGLETFNKKWIVIILLVIGTENILTQLEDFRIKEKNARLLNLEAALDQMSEQDELIMINSHPFPTPMYFAHRKGWIQTNEEMQDPKLINAAKRKGLKHILIMKRSFGNEIELPYQKVIDNEDFAIYSLD